MRLAPTDTVDKKACGLGWGHSSRDMDVVVKAAGGSLQTDHIDQSGTDCLAPQPRSSIAKESDAWPGGSAHGVHDERDGQCVLPRRVTCAP
eukprot:7050995-Pyramimonas_sp.AAC.1